MKHITIIKDDPITGVQYGEVEIPDTITTVQMNDAKAAAQQIENIKKSRAAKIRKNNTRHK